MNIKSYFDTHYAIDDGVIRDNYNNVFGVEATNFNFWMAIKLGRETGYETKYLVDKVGFGLWSHLTKNQPVQEKLKGINIEYLVGFVEKFVYRESEGKFVYDLQPHYLFTSDVIDLLPNWLGKTETDKIYRIII